VTALAADVVAAGSGDRAAFGRLVDACAGVVTSIAVAIVRDPDTGDDVAQEVFLAAWQRVHTLRNPDSFLPWLRQLTRNHAHMVVRSRIRRRRRVDVADDAVLAAAACGQPSARDVLVSAEERAIVADVLAALPDEAREVVTLYYREGRSAAQVGALLGLGEDAVKKRLERARRVVRAEVMERFGEVARRTAPTAAFTAGVVASLGVAAPASAATGALPAVAKAGAGGLAGLALAIGAGLAGVLLTLRGHARHARSDAERRALRRISLVSAALVVAQVAAIDVAARLGSPALLVGSWLVTLPIQLHLCLRAQPRITGRSSPVTTALVIVGAAAGTATIVAAAIALAGRP
jgi:RNA polymerase sigma factor (sigma-70 family)